MLNPDHFRAYVIVPALAPLPAAMRQPNAVELLLGTALQESGLVYLKQGLATPSDGHGLALGFYQMEPETYQDHLRWLQGQDELAAIIIPHGPRPPEDLQWDLAFATHLARVHYWVRAPEPIPDVDDAAGMAQYWGRWWQTQSIPSSMANFAQLYETYVV